MRRASKSQAGDPDRHYQLPHPDLVCVPPALIERTQADLLLHMSLWEQLGVQAGRLARDLADLEASGGCPSDLAQALSEAARMFLQSSPPPCARARNSDDDVYISSNPDLTSSSRGIVKGDCADIKSKGDLVDALESLGFMDARDFIKNHGQARVKAAVIYALSKPPKSITNLTGFIVRLVEKPGRIPAPDSIRGSRQTKPNYLGGRYGHMVQT